MFFQVGGPEVLIAVLVAVMLFGIPIILVVALGALWLRSDDDEAVKRQVAELQAEVAELRNELHSEDAGDGQSIGRDDGEPDGSDGAQTDRRGGEP